MRHAELASFIKERVAIALQREIGAPPPWTMDPILRMYRFCNVYREWDPVSKEVRAWLNCGPNHLEGRAALARYLNEPQSLWALGTAPEWRPDVFLAILKSRRTAGYRIFNPAYIVSTNGVAMDKLEYVIDLVKRVDEQVHLDGSETLAEAAGMFQAVKGVGSFMAGQIIADLKHQPVLQHAPDWWAWCAPGPGSMRGLNRVLDEPITVKWKPADFKHEIYGLGVHLHPLLAGLPGKLDAQNLQNCLCEFDKYMRAKLGEGTPKQLYTPSVPKNFN